MQGVGAGQTRRIGAAAMATLSPFFAKIRRHVRQDVETPGRPQFDLVDDLLYRFVCRCSPAGRDER
jgi:hypothetical protein